MKRYPTTMKRVNTGPLAHVHCVVGLDLLCATKVAELVIGSDIHVAVDIHAVGGVGVIVDVAGNGHAISAAHISGRRGVAPFDLPRRRCGNRSWRWRRELRGQRGRSVAFCLETR